MIIGQLLSPVHSLGPGERVCLWTKGCSKKCDGCISPEFQPFSGDDVSEVALAQILAKVAEKGSCSGLTISGGDPFEQSEALLKLLVLVRETFADILVYTGYKLEEIRSGYAGDAGISCLEYIDVLIDGRYEKELNVSECVLRGSTNQTIHFLNNSTTQSYTEYMKKGRVIENFTHGDKRIITGILNP